MMCHVQGSDQGNSEPKLKDGKKVEETSVNMVTGLGVHHCLSTTYSKTVIVRFGFYRGTTKLS